MEEEENAVAVQIEFKGNKNGQNDEDYVNIVYPSVSDKSNMAKSRRPSKQKKSADLLWLANPYDEEYDEYIYALNKNFDDTITEETPAYQSLLSQVRADGFDLDKASAVEDVLERRTDDEDHNELYENISAPSAVCHKDTADTDELYTLLNSHTEDDRHSSGFDQVTSSHPFDAESSDCASPHQPKRPRARGTGQDYFSFKPPITTDLGPLSCVAEPGKGLQRRTQNGRQPVPRPRVSDSPGTEPLEPPPPRIRNDALPLAGTAGSHPHPHLPPPHPQPPPTPPQPPQATKAIQHPLTPPPPPQQAPQQPQAQSSGDGSRSAPLPSSHRTSQGNSQVASESEKQGMGFTLMKNLLKRNPEQFKNAFFRSVRSDRGNVVGMMCSILREVFPKYNLLIQDDFLDTETGLTVLQVAVIYNCKSSLKYLLEYGGDELILKPRESKSFKNETVLHFAVSNSDNEIIKMLLNSVKSKKNCEQLVNMCMKNSRSYDSSEVSLIHTEKYMGKYLRLERSVDLAIWEKRLDLLPLLAEFGAEPFTRDSCGNTLLHSVVAQAAIQVDDRDYYKQAFDELIHLISKWNAKRNNRQTPTEMDRQYGLKEGLRICNDDNLNPVALAVKLESHLFNDLINLENITKFSQLTLGNITSSHYDITCINSHAREYDDVNAPYRYNYDSCLHIVAHTTTPINRPNTERDIVDTEPFCTLIETKWKFYRRYYLLWFIFHAVYMSIFTCFAFLVDLPGASSVLPGVQSGQNNKTDGNGTIITPQPFMQSARQDLWYLCFLILPFIYMLLELYDLCITLRKTSAKRLFKEASLTGNAIYRLCCVAFSLSIVAWFLCYYLDHPYHHISVAVAMLLGWLFLIFFTRPIQALGVFSIMMQRMVSNDLFPFMMVSSAVLLSFTCAVHAMILNSPEGNTHKGFDDTFYAMFKVMVDLDDKQTSAGTVSPSFSKILLSVYGLLLVILLLNMLIATMNTSYEVIRNTKCNLIRRQRASLLLMAERRLPRCIVAYSERNIIRKGVNTEKQYLYVTTRKL